MEEYVFFNKRWWNARKTKSVIKLKNNIKYRFDSIEWKIFKSNYGLIYYWRHISGYGKTKTDQCCLLENIFSDKYIKMFQFKYFSFWITIKSFELFIDWSRLLHEI